VFKSWLIEIAATFDGDGDEGDTPLAWPRIGLGVKLDYYQMAYAVLVDLQTRFRFKVVFRITKVGNGIMDAIFDFWRLTYGRSETQPPLRLERQAKPRLKVNAGTWSFGNLYQWLPCNSDVTSG
jgi:hypothetical protein